MKQKGKVFVAMSGGVDSAVAAAQLIERGYHVTGIHMETWKDPKWDEESRNLPNPAMLASVTADSLGIPFISMDIQERFYTQVVRNFIQQYLQGQTPNPCLYCNPQVKWGILQSYALKQGADYFATGHYARVDHSNLEDVRLLRGVDPSKDQSYVLSMLSQTQLGRSLLPLGEMFKDQVRGLARAMNLPVADRQDSQELCFLGNVDYRDFLQRFAPESSESGKIVDLNGTVLGEHQGLTFYTIGQRRGIRVAASEPYYVMAKDIENNQLVVGHADQLGKHFLTATGANWIAGHPPDRGEIYGVMVRYRTKSEPATLISATEDDFRLEFKRKVRGIAPGQVAVLYKGEVCLGGGIIMATSLAL